MSVEMTTNLRSVLTALVLSCAVTATSARAENTRNQAGTTGQPRCGKGDVQAIQSACTRQKCVSALAPCYPAYIDKQCADRWRTEHGSKCVTPEEQEVERVRAERERVPKCSDPQYQTAAETFCRDTGSLARSCTNLVLFDWCSEWKATRVCKTEWFRRNHPCTD